MTRPLKKMPTPLGIGVGQTASVQLPIGLTYERLYIRANADVDGLGTDDVVEADWVNLIDEIRLMVDGDSKIQITASDLVALNKYYGIDHKPGVLPLFLSRPWMRTAGGDDQTAYGTAGGMTSFALEMDLKPGVTSIGSLNVYAVQSPGRPFGPHLRIQRYVHNQGVTGEAEISDIVRGPYAMLAMHFNTAAITDVEVLADQRKVHASDAAIRLGHYAVPGRAPQADFTHIDFITENRLSEAMPMALQDFRIKTDFTATGNFSIYTESVQGRSG